MPARPITHRRWVTKRAENRRSIARVPHACERSGARRVALTLLVLGRPIRQRHPGNTTAKGKPVARRSKRFLDFKSEGEDADDRAQTNETGTPRFLGQSCGWRWIVTINPQTTYLQSASLEPLAEHQPSNGEVPDSHRKALSAAHEELLQETRKQRYERIAGELSLRAERIDAFASSDSARRTIQRITAAPHVDGTQSTDRSGRAPGRSVRGNRWAHSFCCGSHDHFTSSVRLW